MNEVEVVNKSLNELASEYNHLVPDARALGLTNYKPISRFKSKEVGLARIEQIKSSIRAAQQSERVVEREEQQAAAEPPVEQPAEPVAEQTAAAQEEPQTKSEDEMARKKKARKPRAKSANGATLEAKTQEFNDLVKPANAKYDPDKKGSKKFKHHTSLFGDHANADKQLKAIRAQAGR